MPRLRRVPALISRTDDPSRIDWASVFVLAFYLGLAALLLYLLFIWPWQMWGAPGSGSGWAE